MKEMLKSNMIWLFIIMVLSMNFFITPDTSLEDNTSNYDYAYIEK